MKENIIKPSYKDDEQILTYNDLKKCIGKYVYFSYEYGSCYYAWMKKVTKVDMPKYRYESEEEVKKHVKHIYVFGTYSMTMYRHGKKLPKPEPSSGGDVTKEKLSNAQWAARFPTKEELKEYLNAIRVYRIYGDNYDKRFKRI